MLSTIQIYSQRFFQEAILMTIKQPSKPGKSVNSNAGVASVNELNTYFTNAISYAGYIVVALGIISLILAFAESSMNSKARGSMLVAGVQSWYPLLPLWINSGSEQTQPELLLQRKHSP